MCGSNEAIGVAALRDDAREVKAEVVAIRRRHKQDVAALLLTWFAIVLLVWLIIGIYRSRDSARKYTEHQQHKLVCAVTAFIPAGDPLGDELRTQYHCPPYVPHRGTHAG